MRIFLGLAVLACGVFGYFSWCYRGDVSPFVVGPVEQSSEVAEVHGIAVDGVVANLGSVPVGYRPQSCTITNRSGRPGRLIGMDLICCDNCCLTTEREMPIDLPPGMAVPFEYSVKVVAGGRFEGNLRLYFDSGTLREFNATITGEGVSDGPMRTDRTPNRTK